MALVNVVNMVRICRVLFIICPMLQYHFFEMVHRLVDVVIMGINGTTYGTPQTEKMFS